ncbi:hypothetical protein HELRODRAFT_70474, partial [Helobdella robusta]|uniref:receptor protein-tyrosine kinase n=1 Tax=Helobdella robusta TaxID=6412 RepID=T1G069_HELRO
SDYEIPLDKAWEFPREKLQVSSILGEGAFGTVYMATAVGVDSSNPEASTKVAVKMLKENASDQDVVDLVQEMEMMKIIGRHKNVLSLLGCCTQNGPLFVILEYAANGNLRDFLRDKRPKNFRLQNCVVEVPLDYLTYKDLVTFALQIAKGMEFLASKMCIHRDLAARNVLVCEDYTLKVADFGLTRNVLKSDYYKKKTDGRLPVKWMAPEALFDRKCTVKSDVWSYGILLWELFSLGGNPYPSVPVEKIFQLLKAGYRMEAPVYSSNEIYSLMLSCWHQSPDHRPSFNKIVNSLHSVLRSVENQVIN